ncbi:TPA: hypothetical protein ACMDSS_002746 [Vibrio parahaemolyticus]|uniref:hypothetical protein n=1 Tax=Vibrio parahaemolyticus TaxID=670 RepID=UPI00084A559A|nr:hypothetical protein [Vibrio parahaemolyticus]EJC7060810.1 hypothetical protein [Vibrio parahaemolyticus]ODY23178.1 hypothetical protein BBM16_00460 [Vibrio parahaemolyticus]
MILDTFINAVGASASLYSACKGDKKASELDEPDRENDLGVLYEFYPGENSAEHKVYANCLIHNHGEKAITLTKLTFTAKARNEAGSSMIGLAHDNAVPQRVTIGPGQHHQLDLRFCARKGTKKILEAQVDIEFIDHKLNEYVGRVIPKLCCERL